MQIIFGNEDERGNSGRTSPMGSVICAGIVGRCIEGKFVGGFRNKRSRIWISGEIFVGIKKGVWRRK